MAALRWNRHRITLDISLNEVTGALGDSVTVLPIVVAIALLTDLQLTWILVWFGAFQIVWGVYYGVPLSVEPMKALAGLLLAGVLTTGEFLVAGLLAGIVLVGIGAFDAIARIEEYLSEPVVRGVQLAVAFILVQTGVDLGVTSPVLAAGAAALALALIVLGYWRFTALAVLMGGGLVAGVQSGVPLGSAPTMALPSLSSGDLTVTTVDAAAAQLAMTVGNAAVATSLLLDDFFDRSIRPDELSTSMGFMNLLAVPLGGIPMCHGSGGVAGKYTFGARTATANLVLGIGYIALGFAAVGLLVTFPTAMLGVILILVALELGRASLKADTYPVILFVGTVGVLTNVGLALVAGIVVDRALHRWRS